MTDKTRRPGKRDSLHKTPTGIHGLDELTFGGLPAGRPTLVCGTAGSGKTLLAMEFLVRGATEYNEPGVFIAFEETEQDLVENVASLGFDLAKLIADKKIVLDHIFIDRKEIEETGEYDLEGLFIRLGAAIDSIGAKRIVLDTLETLFASFKNEAILRSEIGRLFRWLKERGVTAVITAERGESSFTRQGLEEYISDCVILLDHRVGEQVSTRRLRVVKYRGTTHGTNEYPFLIDEQGISILPVTSLNLQHPATNERISSGLKELDHMLEGKGYFQGSSILVSGTTGTGKTSLAASFTEAACRNGKKVVYYAFEESPQQICRNMASIGLDLESHVKSGRLIFNAARSTLFGLEMHLVSMYKLINEIKPDVVVVDPITNLIDAGTPAEVGMMLTRLIDFLKMHNITALMTSLTTSADLDYTNSSISSLIDTLILLRNIEIGSQRTTGLIVVKSRGMAHDRNITSLTISGRGITLKPAPNATAEKLT